MPQTANIVTRGTQTTPYTQVTITDASATTLFSVPLAASAGSGGVLSYEVFASDSTDFQVMAGLVAFGAVNKAATITTNISEIGTPAKAVSSGTLTLAWTMTDDTNQYSVKLQPTGSLTETTYYVRFTILSMPAGYPLS